MSIVDGIPAGGGSRIGLSNVRNWVRERSMRLRHRVYRAVETDHAAAYRRLMAYRVRAHGADHAVGHYQADMGMWQFHLLLDRFGVERDERVLDLGCGSLRAGRYLIPYLDAGNYVGMDVSPDVLDAGRERLFDDIVARKDPRFVVNDDLRLDELREPVDLIWAQSLLTHLPEEDVRELFAALPGALADDGRAVMTFFPDARESAKDFGHSPQTLRKLAAENSLEAECIPDDDLTHPKGQRFLRLTRRDPLEARVPATYIPEPE